MFTWPKGNGKGNESPFPPPPIGPPAPGPPKRFQRA